MPPERIDSLNAKSLKGLVLSLLARIDELVALNKTLLERIAELEGRGGKPVWQSNRSGAKSAARTAAEKIAEPVRRNGAAAPKRGAARAPRRARCAIHRDCTADPQAFAQRCAHPGRVT